jgi:hypothetical protein
MKALQVPCVKKEPYGQMIDGDKKQTNGTHTDRHILLVEIFLRANFNPTPGCGDFRTVAIQGCDSG